MLVASWSHNNRVDFGTRAALPTVHIGLFLLPSTPNFFRHGYLVILSGGAEADEAANSNKLNDYGGNEVGEALSTEALIEELSCGHQQHHHQSWLPFFSVVLILLLIIQIDSRRSSADSWLVDKCHSNPWWRRGHHDAGKKRSEGAGGDFHGAMTPIFEGERVRYNEQVDCMAFTTGWSIG